MQQDRQTTAAVAATSSPPSSSSDRSSSSSAPRTTEESREGMDSDEEIGRVPELGVDQSTSGRERAAAAAATGATSSSNAAQGGATTSGRRRGRSPADKEHRRLKRLLRNRVSAQQARERKKAYVGELEARVKELEKSNLELDERVATLHNENQMLRQILKNTTANRRAPGGGGGSGSAGASASGDGK